MIVIKFPLLWVEFTIKWKSRTDRKYAYILLENTYYITQGVSTL